MKNKILIIFAIVIALAVTAFIIYRVTSSQKKSVHFQNMEKSRDGKITDPFIAGPVKNRILKGYGDINKCYKDYLKSEPKIKEGTLKFDWQIDSDGNAVGPETVAGTFRDKDMEKCITDSISKWEFPVPDSRKYVTHDFKFKFVEKGK